MDWPIQDVFLPHAQYSWDQLQVHASPDQDKALMNELIITILSSHAMGSLFDRKAVVSGTILD